MNVKYFLLVIAILQVLNSYSQKEDNLWLFGYESNTDIRVLGGSNIDFSSDSPQFIKLDRPMNFDLLSYGMSDEQGKILFYTNGIYVANRLDEVMENGDTLNPSELTELWRELGQNLRQGAFAFKVPENTNKYYLFHQMYDWVDRDSIINAEITTLFCSLIDLSYNNGLGKVVQKNIPILRGNLDIMTAVRHGNGRDWWIMIPEMSTNRFFRLLVCPEGILGPFEQIISYRPMQNRNIRLFGNKKFSRDGGIYAAMDIYNGIRVFDFDRCSGLLSNPQVLEFPFYENVTGGLEFSPNNKYLYYDNSHHLMQLDLIASDLNPDTIGFYDGYFGSAHNSFFQQEFAPDGKIYVCSPNGVLEMHRINNPNGKLENCAFVQRDIKLPTANGFTMPHFPNYRLFDDPDCPCDTLGIDGPVYVEGHPYDLQACIGATHYLEVTTLGTYPNYQWQMEENGNWVDLKNDTVFSGVDTALLYFNMQDAGLTGKNFRCVVWNHLNADTSRVAQLTLIDDKPLADFTITQEGNEVQFTNLTTGAIQRSYWQFGDEWIEEQSGIPTNSSHNRLKDPLHLYRAPGWYHPQLIVENGCGRDTVQKDIEIQFPDFYGNFTTTETNLCQVEFDGTRFINKSTFNATYFKYILPGGNHTIAEVPDANIYYNTPGIYDVTFIVSDGTQWDTIYRPDYIKVYTDPAAEIEYSINGHQVTFSTPDFAQHYRWQFGDGTVDTSKSVIHTYDTSGIYQVILSVENACGQASDTIWLNIQNSSVDDAILSEQQIMSLFPNPTSKVLFVNYQLAAKGNEVTIQFIDILGRTVEQKLVNPNKRSGTLQFHFDTMPLGIYFCVLRQDDIVLDVQKFIKVEG